MKNINKAYVGARIREIRLASGMTLEEFGKLFGASKGSAQGWEKGRNLPNKRRIKSIADMANIGSRSLVWRKAVYVLHYYRLSYLSCSASGCHSETIFID